MRNPEQNILKYTNTRNSKHVKRTCEIQCTQNEHAKFSAREKNTRKSEQSSQTREIQNNLFEICVPAHCGRQRWQRYRTAARKSSRSTARAAALAAMRTAHTVARQLTRQRSQRCARRHTAARQLSDALGGVTCFCTENRKSFYHSVKVRSSRRFSVRVASTIHNVSWIDHCSDRDRL